MKIIRILTTILMIFFISMDTSTGQAPIKVSNKSNLYSYGMFTFNDALFCVGSFNGFSGPLRLLKYNLNVDSFELFKYGNALTINFEKTGFCFYELNGKFLIKGAEALFVMNNLFEITKLHNFNGWFYPYIWPHTVIGNKFYFSDDNNTIWETDGTPTGTKEVLKLDTNYQYVNLKSCGSKLIIQYRNTQLQKYQNNYFDIFEKKLINIDDLPITNWEQRFYESTCFDDTFYFNCIGDTMNCSGQYGGIDYFGVDGRMFTKIDNEIFYQSDDGIYKINHSTKTITNIFNTNNLIPPSTGIRPQKLLNYKENIGFINFAYTNKPPSTSIFSYNSTNGFIDSLKLNTQKIISNSILIGDQIFLGTFEGIVVTNLSNLNTTKLICKYLDFDLKSSDSTNLVVFNDKLFFRAWDKSNLSSIYYLDLKNVLNINEPEKSINWTIYYDPLLSPLVKLNNQKNSNKTSLSIFSALGSLVDTKSMRNSNSIEYDTGLLNPGFYVFVVEYDGRRESFKVLRP